MSLKCLHVVLFIGVSQFTAYADDFIHPAVYIHQDIEAFEIVLFKYTFLVGIAR